MTIEGMTTNDWSEFRDLRERIKTPADKIRPGLGAELGAMPRAMVRQAVNEITGECIPNGEVIRCMRQLAEAMERRAAQCAP